MKGNVIYCRCRSSACVMWQIVLIRRLQARLDRAAPRVLYSPVPFPNTIVMKKFVLVGL